MNNIRVDWPTSIAASVIATLAVTSLIYVPGLIIVLLTGGAAWWIWNQFQALASTKRSNPAAELAEPERTPSFRSAASGVKEL